MAAPAFPVAPFAEPFDEDLVEDIDGLSNVAPHHYISRLIAAAAGHYSVEFSAPVFYGKTAISVLCKVTLHTKDGDRVFTANGSEPMIDQDGEAATDPKTVAFLIKNAQSDALKLALKHAGIGLDLYNAEKPKEEKQRPTTRTRTRPAAKPEPEEEPEDEEEEEEAAPPPRRSSTTRSNSNSRGGSPNAKGARGGWTGELTIKGGAHDGDKFNKLTGNYVNWRIGDLEEKGQTDGALYDMLTKERARRKKAGSWDPEEGAKKGGSKPAKKRNLNEDDEDNF